MANYEDIQNIEINATYKLLLYIDSMIDIHKLYNEVSENFNFFKDESSRLAFNSWLTIDYNPERENTFIEDFLKKVPTTLNQLERNILRGKSNSFISLIEIKEIQNEYLIVKDILNDREYKLWEPKLKGLMKEGEIFLSRVARSLDNYRFIGDVNYLPLSVKPIFMENLLIDFNAMRKKDQDLDIQKYLKTYTLNIYKIYETAIFSLADVQFEEDYLLFSQLEEFESFLSTKLSPINVKKYINNLMNIYEFKFEAKNMNIKDILLLDLKIFLKECIEEEFILTKDEFNSYLDTLKAYLRFLSSIDRKHINSYKEILDISSNRFKYLENMKSKSEVFNIDPTPVNIVGKYLDDDMMIILKDLDIYLSFVDELSPKLTKTNKFIRRKDLVIINERLNMKYCPLSKAPNQVDYPLVDFLYFASLDLGLCEIIGDKLYLNENINYLSRLNDEEKHYLLCDYILNRNFLNYKFPEKNFNLIENFYTDYKDFVQGLEDIKEYYSLFALLEILNIIKFKSAEDNIIYHIEITSFGKTLVNYFINNIQDDKRSNIIYFPNLKNK